MTTPTLFRFKGDDEAEWAAGATANATPVSGSLRELARAASGHRCTLLAPAQDVVLTTAAVPSRRRNVQLRAVPFAVEDQFAEDVEHLHFAVGERPDVSGRIAVAAVRDELLRGWLDMAGAAGVNVGAVVPEVLLVPLSEGEWTVLMDGDRVLVRTGPYSGFSAARSDCSLYLRLALNEVAEAGPQRVRVIGGELEMDDNAAHSVELVCEPSAPSGLAALVRVHGRALVLNLLQGMYSQRARLGRFMRPWRAAAVLAVAAITVQFALHVVERSRLEQLHSRLLDDIERVYREAFPEARRVVNPQVQMERALRDLREGSDAPESTFLALLEKAGPVLKSAPGLRLTGMNYRQGALTLTVSAGSLATLDKVRGDLQAGQALEVEIQSASSREGQVTSRLQIRKAG